MKYFNDLACLTRIEQDGKYKQQVCTDKTIQNNVWIGAATRSDDNSETSHRKHQKTSRRGADGQMFHCAVCLYEYTWCSRVRDTFTAASY